MSPGESSILDPRVETYLDGLVPPSHPVLTRMQARAEAERFPAVGPRVGALLALLVRISGARSILELGSGFGYSGLWMALALPADGRILLSDRDARREELVRGFFRDAGVEKRMEFRAGDGLEILAGETGPFDLVFNDIDKEQYPAVVEPAARVLRSGGLFITDNTLWYGRVAEQSAADPATAGVRRFNAMLAGDSRFDTVILPLRDGVTLARRK